LIPINAISIISLKEMMKVMEDEFPYEMMTEGFNTNKEYVIEQFKNGYIDFQITYPNANITLTSFSKFYISFVVYDCPDEEGPVLL
jgi:hypothetical protein